MGIVETQVRSLAPFVKRIIRWTSQPRVGYIVAGCSGTWPDGIIMEVFKDERLTRGKVIYWFYRGNLPDTSEPGPLHEAITCSDIRFVRCDDLDYLFMKIWYFLKNAAIRGGAWLLDEYDLFARPTAHEYLRYRSHQLPARWWRPTRKKHRFYLSRKEQEYLSPDHRYRIGTRAQHRNDLGIPALRKKLLPVFKDIEKWDKDSFMPYECLPRRLRERFDFTGTIESLGGEAPPIEQLRNAVSPRIPWTRRNRQLLSIALAPHTNPFLSHDLLRAIDDLGGLDSRRIGRSVAFRG